MDVFFHALEIFGSAVLGQRMARRNYSSSATYMWCVMRLFLVQALNAVIELEE